MDRQKWTLGTSRLTGFAAHIPQSVSEDYVQQYHEIVALLEEASEQDLSHFKVSPERLKPRITSVRRGGFGGGPGHATYSDKRYCDSDYFLAQVDGLKNYLPSIRIGTEGVFHASEANRYDSISDDKLQDMLVNRRIRPKARR